MADTSAIDAFLGEEQSAGSIARPLDTSALDGFLEESAPTEARKLLAEYHAGHHDDFDHEHLVSLKRIAQGNTTAAERAREDIKGALDFQAYPGKIAELAKSIGSGVAGLAKEGEEGKSSLGALRDIAAGGAVGLAKLTEPITGLATGVVNLAAEDIAPRLGLKYDSAEANVSSDEYAHRLNRELEKGAKLAGADTDSYSFAAGENVVPFAFAPELGLGKASAFFGKAADLAVEGGTKAAGKVLQKAGAVAANPLIQAAIFAGTGHGHLALGVLGVKGLSRFPWVNTLYHAAVDGTIGQVRDAGAFLSKLPNGDTIMEGLENGLKSKAQTLRETLTELETNSKNLRQIEEAKAISSTGEPTFADDLLSGDGARYRKVQNQLNDLEAKSERLKPFITFNQVLSNFTKGILQGAGNVAAGGTIGGLFAAGSAQPGDIEAIQSGVAMGGALTAPFVPLLNRAGIRQNNLSELVKQGQGKFEAHPFAKQGMDALGKLEPTAQELINKTSGLSVLGGGKPIMPLNPPELVKALAEVEGVSVSEPPSGYEGKDVTYVNTDHIAAGNVPHEMIHGTKLDENPAVVAAAEKIQKAQPGKVQAALDRYHSDLRKSNPDYVANVSTTKELIAALGVDLLRELPPEALFGGRSSGQLLSKWFQEKFGREGVTTQYGFPVSPELRNALRDALFDLGKRAEQSSRNPASSRPREQQIPAMPSGAPEKPAAATIPELNQNVTAEPQAPTNGLPAGLQEEAARFVETMGAKDADQKVIAAIGDLQAAGEPVSLEGVVARALQRSVPRREESGQVPSIPPPLKSATIQEVSPNQPETSVPSISPQEQVSNAPEQIATSKIPEVTASPIAERGMEPLVSQSSKETATAAIPALSEEKVSPITEIPKTSESPQISQPDYAGIRAEAEAAKRAELANTKRKTKEAEIHRAGIEAAAQAHAQIGTTDLISWRENRYGKPSISGKRLDPNDPFHQELLKESGLSPADQQKLTDLQDRISQTVAIDYLHAPEASEASGITRKGEQAESTAPERVAGEKGTRRLTKSFVPTWITYNIPSKTFEVNGFSPDKFLNNAKLLIPEGKRLGIKGYESVNDPLLAKDFQAMVENYKNGYTMTGKPIEGSLLTPVKPNPDFKPTVIPKDRADLLNAMLGNDTARVGTRKATPEKADKQILAQQNSLYWEPATGETNKLRAELGDEAKLLESTSETLRPELIDKIRDEAVNDEQTLRPAGFTGDRSVFAEKGLPNSTFAAGGFLPAPENLKAISEKLGLRFDGESLGGRALAFTDLQTGSTTDVPAKATPEQLKQAIEDSRMKFKKFGNFQPAPDNPKAIYGPAIKLEDGNVISMKDGVHMLLIHELDRQYGEKANQMLSTSVHGWRTNDGEFLENAPALSRALSEGQITEKAYQESEKYFGNTQGPKGLEALSFNRAKKRGIPALK